MTILKHIGLELQSWGPYLEIPLLRGIIKITENISEIY